MKKFSLAFLSMIVLVSTFFASVSFAATVGQGLTAPEQGWKRYNDADPLIRYEGSFELVANATSYNNDSNMTTILGDKVKFDFMGTKLRLIGAYVLNRSNNITVYIDGENAGTFSEYGNTTGVGQILVYEKLGLTNARHTVEIVNNTTSSYTYFSLDAIDIDDTGYLLPEEEPEQPVHDRALLTIHISGGQIKEYDLSAAELSTFLNWYDAKDAGSGPAKYAFTKTWNKGPFKTRTEYVIFDKILSFDVDEYEVENP